MCRFHKIEVKPLESHGLF